MDNNNEETNNVIESNNSNITENQEPIHKKEDKKEQYLKQINLFLESIKDIKLEESHIPSNSNLETKATTFNKTLTKIKNELSNVRFWLYQEMNKQKSISHKNKPIFNKRETNEASIEEGDTRKVHSATIILKQLLYRALISQYQEGEMMWNMLCGFIRSSTSSWLQQLLAIPSTTKIEFQDQETTIRGIILRAITKKNPSFKENGFLALKKIPAIYTTSPSIVSEAVRGLCLPSTCIKPIPVNRSFGHSHTMEAELLKQMIEQDLSNSENQEMSQQYEPTVVIALARADGHIDDTEKVKKVCDEFGVWLHVHGDSVAILFGSEEHKKKKIVSDIKKHTDSFSFHPERSFHGLGGEQEENILSTIINTTSSTDPLSSSNVEVSLLEAFKEQKRSSDWWDQNTAIPFSLWFLLQSFGSETLESGVSRAIDLANLLSEQLSKMENLELDNAHNSLKVVFRFKLSNVEVDFLNKLNQQLLKDMEKDPAARTMGIKMMRVDQFLALVFDPLSSADLNLITNELVINFCKNLQTAIQVRISTMHFRSYFQEKANQSKSLFFVETDRLFVGLGAVKYIPTYLKHQKEIAPQIDNQLDVLNSALAQQLSEIDGSFSEGFTFTQTISTISNKESNTSSSSPQTPSSNTNTNSSNERRTCVLLINNRIIDEKTIDDWIHLIEKEGTKIEESSNLLENLSKIIEQGIKQAQKQIKEDSYANETGIIRSVPIIGSVWNWWSPAQKKEVVGRTFDLAGSKLETTKVVVNTPVKHNNQEPKNSTPSQQPPSGDSHPPTTHENPAPQNLESQFDNHEEKLPETNPEATGDQIIVEEIEFVEEEDNK